MYIEAETQKPNNGVGNILTDAYESVKGAITGAATAGWDTTKKTLTQTAQGYIDKEKQIVYDAAGNVIGQGKDAVDKALGVVNNAAGGAVAGAVTTVKSYLGMDKVTTTGADGKISVTYKPSTETYYYAAGAVLVLGVVTYFIVRKK